MILRSVLTVVFTTMAMVPAVQADVITPESDDREHAHFELDNGLTVMVVSDPEASTVGAAMSVDVGSDNDPDKVPGLAHLLEHMVFSGSEAYPERGGFSEFISRQGGRYNGYTASDHSSFFFQVQPGALDKALARFSDFLISPTLDSEDVDREIQIIQYEYDGQKGQQRWEELSVFRKMVNPAHPFSRFNMGNRASFELVKRDTLMEKLSTLFETHYRAGDMKLVVQGSESVDALRDRIETLFSDIPAGSAPETDLPPLLSSDELPRWVHASGDGSDPRLTLSFPVEPPHQSHEVLPYSYIAELITSKQDNRLREAFRDRGWISDLSASHRVNAERYATFDITLLLTEKGLDNRKAVTALVHNYLETIREEGVQETLYRDQKRAVRQAFHNSEQASTLNYVAHLASALQRYEPEVALSAPSLMRRYDEDVIRSALDQLRPANMVVTEYVPGESWSQEDPYSSATYSAEKPGNEQLNQWLALEDEPEFRVASAENPYVEKEHQLVDRNLDQTKPREVAVTEDREGFDVWFLQDQLFESPKGAVFIALDHPVAYEAENGAVKTGVYSMVLNEALKPLIQKGEKAGLSVTATRTNHGVGLRIYGFTGKQQRFVADVLDRIQNLNVTEEYLDKALARFEQQVNQYRNIQPFQKLLVSLRADTHPRQSMPDKELAVAESVTVDELQDFHNRLWEKPAVEALLHGNYDRESAREMARVLAEGLGGEFSAMADRADPIKSAEVAAEEAESIPGKNSAAVYYARQPLKPGESAELTMLTQMLNEHLFSAVRNKQPMGYVAFASPNRDYQRRGPVFGIQAPGVSPEKIQQRLESELEKFIAELDGLSESEFETYRQGVRSQLQKPKERLASYSRYWWREIQRFGEPVDELNKAADELDSLTVDGLISFARELLQEDDAAVLVRTTGA